MDSGRAYLSVHMLACMHVCVTVGIWELNIHYGRKAILLIFVDTLAHTGASLFHKENFVKT